MKEQNRQKPAANRKKTKHSKQTFELRQKNESDSEVEQQLRIGRKFIVKYREVFEKLAKG